MRVTSIALVALAVALAAMNVFSKRTRGMTRIRRGGSANGTSHDASGSDGRSHAANATAVSGIDGTNAASDAVAAGAIATNASNRIRGTASGNGTSHANGATSSAGQSHAADATAAGGIDGANAANATATGAIATDHDADAASWGASSWHDRVRDESMPHFYLEGSNEYAGLGHSFMSFNRLVMLARGNDLIPRFNFTTTGHRLDPTRIGEYFFGGAFMTPYHAGMEDGGCTAMNSTPDSLRGDLSGIRNEGANCAVLTISQKDTKPRERGVDSNLPLFRELFDGNDERRRSVIKREAKETDAVNVAVHIRRGDLFWWLSVKGSQAAAISQAGARLVATSAYVEVLRQLFWKLAKFGERTINVHLFCQGMKGNSMVPEVDGTFVDLAAVTMLAAQDPYFMTAPERSRHQSLFAKHAANYGFVSKETAVELLSESDMDPESIEKILALADDPADGKLRRAEFVIAMHLRACVAEKGLALPPPGKLPPSLGRIRGAAGAEPREQAPRQKIDLNGSVLNVAFSPGSSDDLQAFDDMCRSDILITGKSGLSYVVSVLCGEPVILAMPFWLPYDYIPNAMTLEEEKGEHFLPSVRSLVNVTESAIFDEARFESLWRNRKS